ncbi:MAG TPA: carboxypeptidase-like regulatory domain-containing protein [Verrucomicrobiae bacterium]
MLAPFFRGQARLQAADAAPHPAPKFAVHGRVIGPDGQPMPKVWVERDGVGMAQGRGWGWEQEGWPGRVLTDANGEFIFGRDARFTEIQTRINAPGFAPHMEWLSVTNIVQTIKLDPGAAVRGRVLQDGEPLAGVRIGISGKDRSSEIFAGHFETAAGADGTFEFAHLPASTSWSLYGIIPSFTNHAALAIKTVQTGADGTTNELGGLNAKPALHLAGKIKTRHGGPLPSGMTVQLGYDDAWDSQSAGVGKNGEFRFDGLFAGSLSVWVQVNHWRLAAANRSRDIWNVSALAGLLERDKDDLTIEIESGDVDYSSPGYSSGNGQLPPQDLPRGRPLEGVEVSGLPAIILDGQVVDDETGKLLARFEVTPGYQPPRAPTLPKTVIQQLLKPFATKTVPWNELPFWNYRGKTAVTNGLFSLEYVALSSKPIFRVEADGYEPYQSEPVAATTRNLLVRLKHGTGPNGAVLLPNGEPASGATVIYAAGHDTFKFDTDGIGPNGPEDKTGRIFQRTGARGDFSFQPRTDGRTIFVSHPAGWAEEDVRQGGDHLELRLKPWASITGTLIRNNGAPAPGEVVAVTMSMNGWSRGEPCFYFQQTFTTDAQGRFFFSNMPPRDLFIERRVPSGVHSWSDIEQTSFTASAGVTNDLRKVTLDSPPPPPLGEEIKRKLGL